MLFWAAVAVSLFLVFLLVFGIPLSLRLASWTVGMAQPRYAVRVERDVVIGMRDGVKLVADVYRPSKKGVFPTIITRTPYEKGEKGHQYPFLGRLFACQGYACIVQDTRGKHQSEGDFYPFAHEDFDGVDTVDWVTQQEWSDGKVGMFGASYLGLTQWLAAPQQSDSLRALVPIFISQKAYDIVRGQHGVLHFRDVLVWHFLNSRRHKRQLQEEDIDFSRAAKHLPIISADAALGEVVDVYRDWIQHSNQDGYWGQWRVDKRVAHIKAPALVIAGWYDRFVDSSIEDFNRMRGDGGSDDAKKSRLIIGPWVHEPRTVKFPSRNFGKDASPWRQLPMIFSWFDRWLRDTDARDEDEYPIRIFVMGINEWRMEKEWPLDRTDYRRYYLHSGGGANTRDGDGWLSIEMPQEEAVDNFLYDPEDPVPTCGGNEVFGKATQGPRDQELIENRSDVLVYSTPPLTSDVEVTGPIELHLFASTDGPDTDFTAKLCDVLPNGKSIHIKSGIVRARYRNSLKMPELLQPGEVVEYVIKIGPTSNVFQKGHRIRLQVSSSCFPQYSRNLNTEEDPHHSTTIRKARQSIYHSGDKSSYLLLPLV